MASLLCFSFGVYLARGSVMLSSMPFPSSFPGDELRDAGCVADGEDTSTAGIACAHHCGVVDGRVFIYRLGPLSDQPYDCRYSSWVDSGEYT